MPHAARLLVLSLALGAIAAPSIVACAPSAPPHLAADETPASDAAGRRLGPRVTKLDRPGWVLVETSILASEQEAPAQARERARSAARQAAVEFVAGVRVRSSLLSLEQSRGGAGSELVQMLSAVSSNALVVGEVLRESRVIMQPGGGYRVHVVLEAKVLAPQRDADAFSTELALAGDGRYAEGDALSLRVRASRDARIIVLVVSDDQATMLLPNRHRRDTRVRAGEWLDFPDERLVERGVRLEARLPEGRRSSEEVVIAIALRADRRIEDAFPASASPFRSATREHAPIAMSELLSPLAELPADAWAFDQEALRISRR